MKIREIYYKVICNRLATGEWLYRVGITNSNVLIILCVCVTLEENWYSVRYCVVSVS